MSVDIGAQLKRVREMNKLSQRELAKRAGVTNSTISLIEQNRVSPSVSSLKKVLEGIPISLADFFTMDLTEKKQVFFGAEELPDLGTKDIAYYLLAFNRPDRAMSIIHEVHQPGSDTGVEMLKHSGEEGGVVIKGEIELTVDGEIKILKQGDGYYFDSLLPHRFRNLTEEVCELITANTPPV